MSRSFPSIDVTRCSNDIPCDLVCVRMCMCIRGTCLNGEVGFGPCRRGGKRVTATMIYDSYNNRMDGERERERQRQRKRDALHVAAAAAVYVCNVVLCRDHNNKVQVR